jgi:hypothetical protein
METELRKILTEIYRGQKENNDEAVERILLLLNVVGQSEQLVLFADWLQYNGKWQLPEEQVKSFLKEQKQN